MINNIQEEVDTYEGMGLPALQKLQQQNPKLLVGIALENLEKTVQEDQRAKLMGTGEVGPSVIDKKLMGLGNLGQQEAFATARPGLQQRGKQMQAAQMRKAMGMQPGMQRGMQQAPMRMAGGGIVGFDDGGNVREERPEYGEGISSLDELLKKDPRHIQIGREKGKGFMGNRQPIIGLMERYKPEFVNNFLMNEKYYKDALKNADPRYRDVAQQTYDNFLSGLKSRASGLNFLADLEMIRGGPSDYQTSLRREEGEKFRQNVHDIIDKKKAKGETLNGMEQLFEATRGDGMAGGGVVGFANRGLVQASDVDIEDLLTALMMTESGGDPDAVGGVGELGAYQIRPSTAAQPGFGVTPFTGDLFDPEASRDFSREYLQALIDRYDGDVEAALIAYNAGYQNADNFVSTGRDYEGLPHSDITQPYIRKILGQMEGQSDEERRRGMNVSPGLAAAERRRTLRNNPAIGSLRGVGRRQEESDEERRRGVNVSPGLAAAERRRILRNNPAIGSLRGVGRNQDQSAQGGIGYLQSIGRKQEEEAKRASNFLKMMQGQEDMIARANPATNLEGIDINEEFVVEGGMESPAQRMRQAFPGAANAAARYAMSPKDTAPQKTRGNNLFTNVRDDFSEILDFVQGLFNEGGEVRGFQEGDLVELEGGEQGVPIESVVKDEGKLSQIYNFAAENPGLLLSMGLMLVPGGGLFALGRAGAAAAKYAPRGLAALKGSFGPGGVFGAGSKTRNVLSSPFTKRNIDPRIGVRDPGLGKTVSMKEAMKPRGKVSRGRDKSGKLLPNAPARDPLVAPRVFSRLQTARSGAGVGLGAAGLGSFFGSDETAAQNPEALTEDMQRLQQELPNVYAGLKQGTSKYAQDKATRSREGAENARNRMQGKGGQEDRGGILSRLGSALSSDRANSLYDAFQTLGMAGGAARGQEGTQLIANQMARDFQQQELDTMRERIDVDREAFATQERLAQFDLIQSLVGSVTFDTLAERVAEELQQEVQSTEVQNETLKRLLGAITEAAPGLFIGGGGATGGGGGTGGGGSSVVRDALNVVGE